MKLTELCIRRPVLAAVINLVLVVIGIVTFQRITVQYFPTIPHPVVTVSTSYQGASADLMETQVTNIIEGALSSVAGVDYMTSSSSTNSSSITIYFNMSSDFDEEVSNVRDKVASVRQRLPSNVTPPIVSTGGVERPVLNLGFYDDHKNQEQVRDYIVRFIQPTLAEVQGVGAVWVFGSGDYALRIWLNSEKMAALGVTVADVVAMLNANNVNFPAGQVLEPDRIFTVISDVQLKTPEEFANLIITDQGGKPIFLKDVAQVQWGNSNLQESPMLINGKNAIDVEVRPRFGENPIEVAKQVRLTLKQIETNLPQGMHVFVTYDQSYFLKSALDETELAVLYAVILVMIVIYLFLGSLRGTLIPIITIPLCLIDVFGVMILLGFTLNIMTLLAMVLAIGLVVDDAIVVLENIYRHVEHGISPFEAAIKGANEIAFPVISMTLTLAAVYAPIGFAQGLSAVVFKEFAFTLAGAVIISGFIALTLSPMMCSKIVKAHIKENKLQLYLTRLFSHLSTHYRRYLTAIVHHRRWIVLAWVILAALGFLFYLNMPAEFIPEEDIGYFTTTVKPPSGASVHYIDQQMAKLDAFYKAEPAIAYYATFVLGNGPTSFVSLKPWGERKQSLQQVLDTLAPQLSSVPGVTAYTQVPSAIDFGNTDDNDMTLQIMTTQSYEHLALMMEKLVEVIKQYPGLQQVEDNLKFNNQQYKVSLKRDAIGTYNVNPQDVANTLTTMLGGSHVTDVMLGNRSYNVMVQMQKEDLENFQGIDKLYVPTANGSVVPLANLVALTPSIGQISMSHFNRLRSGSITAQFAPGYTGSDIVSYMASVVPKYIGPTERYAFSGRITQYLSSQGNMSSLFILSIIFIYLILAAQFESFIDPFVILLSVPLSIVGAMLVLWCAGGTLNLYTNIGMITLVGLIAKHGILITQFANTLREQGLPLLESIVEAAVIRLRPILMTTAAMILGSIPLALASGPGSISHRQIGAVIVGGLFFGTFFSLIVVPVAYYYLSKFKMKHLNP